MKVLKLARFLIAPAVIWAVVLSVAPGTDAARPWQVAVIAVTFAAAFAANFYMAMKEDE